MSTTTGATRAIWLLLLKGGGWWTSAECAKDSALDAFLNVSQTLYSMERSGVLVRRKRDGKSWEFAVTPACRVAEGVTLKDLQAALSATTEDAA